MLSILTLGGATIDTILEYSEPETLNLQSTHGTLSYLLLEEGKKIEVTSLGFYTGGGATNSAVAFKRLGFHVAAFFKVGMDAQGERIFQELQNMDIDTQWSTIDPVLQTANSYIIPSLKGDRTVLASRGANAGLLEKDLPFNAIKAADCLYITSLSGLSAAQLPILTQFAQRSNVKVAINPGISQLRLGGDFIAQALPFINILILNSSEAKQLMVSLVRAHDLKTEKGSNPSTTPHKNNRPELLFNAITHEDIRFSLTDFFRHVLALGPQYVVVTDGDKGVYAAHEKYIYFHPSVALEKIVNTLGAGDAFGSSFVAMLMQEGVIETAIRAGVVNSAAVVGVCDAKTGLLGRRDLARRVSRLDRHLLQRFKY